MTPELVRATIMAGGSHHQAGRLTEARLHYERVLQADPRQPDALNLLGMIDYAQGNTPLALSRIEQAIAINPRVPGFHTNLGIVLHATGDNHAAAQALRHALQVKPDHLAALYNLGVVLQALEEVEAAAKTYLAALRLNPNLRDVWNNLGNCQAAIGQPDAALQSFHRASQIDPQFAAARINAAGLLLTMGKLDEAERTCRAVIQHHPGQAEAHYNLGLALMKRNAVAQAADAFHAVLKIRPDHDEATLHLGHALFELGARGEAIAHYRAIIARSPHHAAARLAHAVAAIPMMTSQVAQSAQVLPDFAQATTELEEWTAAHPGALAKAVGSVQPFLLAYRRDNVTASLARFGRLVCRDAGHARSPFPAPAVTGRARLRLGIVSGQVRAHPVWKVILRGILEGLDRNRFDIRLYDTGDFRDADTEWAARAVDHYRCQPRSIDQWADHIGQEAPDILLYPEVGMDPVVGALAPLRLARLQMASWGHPVTTGLPSIDAYLSGDLIEPDNADAHYTERLIRLPGTGVLTRFDTPTSRHWNGPQRQPGHVRFALCQQPMKFDPRDDALFARIAQDAGPSEFWVVQSRKHPWASQLLMQRLTAAFAAAGLDPARHLHATPWMDEAEFLGFLDAMDVMLDCPAFSGYTTAWQAIHRGTPIVTLAGPAMRQRLAAGLLQQIGHTDGIARDPDHYVAQAIEHSHQSRSDGSRRRHALAEAAPRADGNSAAIDAMRRLFLNA